MTARSVDCQCIVVGTCRDCLRNAKPWLWTTTTMAEHMNPPRRVWWLYDGGEIVGSVLDDATCTSHDAIRAKAIAQHRALPLCAPELPYVHELKLQRSEVRA